jgi:hypothetical protein
MGTVVKSPDPMIAGGYKRIGGSAEQNRELGCPRQVLLSMQQFAYLGAPAWASTIS